MWGYSKLLNRMCQTYM